MHNFLGSLGFHARTFQWEFFQDNKIKIRKKINALSIMKLIHTIMTLVFMTLEINYVI